MKSQVLWAIVVFAGTIASVAWSADTVRTEEFVFRNRRTQVELVRKGDRDYYQGDILFNVNKVRQRLAGLNNTMPPGDSGNGTGTSHSGLAAVVHNELWPRATIPFEIEPGFPNPRRITDAIAHWEANTPLRFVRRTNQNDYVRFERDSDSCASYVGRDGGQQVIQLADACDKGSVIHEIGHAAGVFHEQSREDRDQHVLIHWENIESWKGHNFKKYTEEDFLFWGSRDGRDVGPYDFSSIMHYGSFFFSDNGRPTITRRFGCTGDQCLIQANRTELSALDKMYIHEIYCPMLGWDAARCGKYYSPGGSFAYRIQTRSGALGGGDTCLDVEGGSQSNQAKINGFGCHMGDNQLWYVDLRSDGYFTIRAKHSGLCLDVPGGTTGYTPVQQFACHGGDNQKWRLYGPGSTEERHGRYQIRAKRGGMCLGLDWQNKLVTTDCTSSGARSFSFIAREAPNLFFRLRNQQSQECLDIPFATSNAVPLQTHACHTGENQKWRFLPKADDSFEIQSSQSRKCVTISNGRIEQNDCGTADQSVVTKNIHYYLLPDGGVELRTRSFPRQCVKYDGPGRLVIGSCDWGRSEKWGPN